MQQTCNSRPTRCSGSRLPPAPQSSSRSRRMIGSCTGELREQGLVGGGGAGAGGRAGQRTQPRAHTAQHRRLLCLRAQHVWWGAPIAHVCCTSGRQPAWQHHPLGLLTRQSSGPSSQPRGRTRCLSVCWWWFGAARGSGWCERPGLALAVFSQHPLSCCSLHGMISHQHRHAGAFPAAGCGGGGGLLAHHQCVACVHGGAGAS